MDHLYQLSKHCIACMRKDFNASSSKIKYTYSSSSIHRLLLKNYLKCLSYIFIPLQNDFREFYARVLLHTNKTHTKVIKAQKASHNMINLFEREHILTYKSIIYKNKVFIKKAKTWVPPYYKQKT